MFWLLGLFQEHKQVLVLLVGLLLTACATKKTATTGAQMQGDVYTGTDTVKYLVN